ncbi:hypothetical protein [Jannaschia donghaensis]|uniref:hypothetical protein n=1 Tax=Jannaschia donghaensis TaxID=420998 RepID=UPI000AD91BD9|nr:hypothetical protein [Jannaschia donghaensis]
MKKLVLRRLQIGDLFGRQGAMVGVDDRAQKTGVRERRVGILKLLKIGKGH